MAVFVANCCAVLVDARVMKGRDGRVEELRERFGEGPVSPLPPSIRGGVVQSPIPHEAAAEMSDDEWFDAIARYPTARHD